MFSDTPTLHGITGLAVVCRRESCYQAAGGLLSGWRELSWAGAHLVVRTSHHAYDALHAPLVTLQACSTF